MEPNLNVSLPKYPFDYWLALSNSPRASRSILMKDVDASVILFEMNYMYNKTSDVCYESE